MIDTYSNDKDDKWRYVMGQSGAKPLLTVGLNPSTATREKLDPTVSRVKRVAEVQGFDGFIMMNLYPVRATDYRGLPKVADAAAFRKNLDEIEKVVERTPDPHVWAAWGASVTHHGYFGAARDQLYERLKKHGVTWLRYGELTDGGHPRHPSRLNYDWDLVPFDIKPYG